MGSDKEKGKRESEVSAHVVLQVAGRIVGWTWLPRRVGLLVPR